MDRTNYKNGKMDGLEEVYFNDGSVWGKECYKNDKKVEMSNCEKQSHE